MKKYSLLLAIALLAASCGAVWAITKTPAKDITVDTSSFDKNLYAGDDTVQKALQSLNDIDITANVNWDAFPNDQEYIKGVNWGDIKGTISNQTDLASALNGKEPTLTKGDATAGTGISVSGGTGAVIGSGMTITNTAPDQTVAIAAGSGIGVSGTYPSFTIANTKTETDPVWESDKASYYTKAQGDGRYLQDAPSDNKTYGRKNQNWTEVTTIETDPVWSSEKGSYYTADQIDGFAYLQTEIDPIYSSSSWATTVNNSGNWDTAYGWGDHSSEGYLKDVNWSEMPIIQPSGINWTDVTEPVLVGVNWDDFLRQGDVSATNWADATTVKMTGINWTDYEDTLATVTTRGATTTNRITTGNHTITDDGSASMTVNAVPAGVSDIDTYTKLLLHFDGANGGTTFTDSSSSAKTVTPTYFTTSTTKKKYGTAAGFRTPGQIGSLTVPNSTDWDVSGDYTIDFWMYLDASSGAAYTKGIIGTGTNASSSGWAIGHYLDTLSLRINSTVYNGAGTITIGGWQHVALVWSDTSFKAYLDGTQVYSGTAETVDTSNDLKIFNYSPVDENRYSSGYIDELRISKGIARWTSNFTPPTSAYSQLVSNPQIILKGSGVQKAIIETDGADSDKIKILNASGTVLSTLDQSGNLLNAGTITTPSLTATRVPYTTTGGRLTDTAGFTFDGTILSVANIKDAGLTSGRMTFATTAGQLTDDADCTFATDTLSCTKLLAPTSLSSPSHISTGAIGITPASGSNLNVTLATTGDFAVNTNQLYVDTSATKVGIGTSTPSSKLHVLGASPNSVMVDATAVITGGCDASATLLTHLNQTSTIVEENCAGTGAKVITNTNVTLESSDVGMGSGSGIFDGASSKLTIPNLRTGNVLQTLTFEAMIKPSSTTGGLYSMTGSDNIGDIYIGLNGGKLYVKTTKSANGCGMMNYIIAQSSAITVTTGVWQKIYVSFDGVNTFHFGLDGTVETRTGSTTGNVNYCLGSSKTLGYTPDLNYFSGLMDEVRVTVGSERYTNSYTPRTTEWDNTATALSYVTYGSNGTSMMSAGWNGADNAYEISTGALNSGTAVSTLDQSGNQVFAGAVQATDATLTGLTLGSIPFVGTGGLLSQDNTNLFWDDTNKRLGVGTTAPRYLLDLLKKSDGSESVMLNLQNTGTLAGTKASLQFTIGGRVGKIQLDRTTAGEGNDMAFFVDSTATGSNTTERMRITSRGNVGIGTSTPSQILDINGTMKYDKDNADLQLDYGSITFSQVTPPSTVCTATDLGVSDGNLTASNFRYKITYITNVGETTQTLESDVVAGPLVNGKIQLTNIPVSDNPVVTGRKIYRRDTTQGGPSGYYSVYVGTINDNTTTEWLDNVANPGYAVGAIKGINTAGGGMFGLAKLNVGNPGKSGYINIYNDDGTGTAASGFINFYDQANPDNYLYQFLIDSTKKFSLSSASGQDCTLLLNGNGNTTTSIAFVGAGSRGSYTAKSDYNHYIAPNAGFGAGHLIFQSTGGTGNFKLLADNSKAMFGAGQDSSIYYDGTNLIINPKEVGSGYLDVLGSVKSTDYRISALNTAPASASAAGTLGEIRVTADAIYVCTATDTWVKASLATW